MKILKFGGTSVGTVEALRRCGSIIGQELPQGGLVVVSALSGTTDTLLRAMTAAAKGDGATAADLQTGLEARHRALAETLGLSPVLKPLWQPLFQSLADLLKGMGKRIAVVSTMLNPAQHAGITVVQSEVEEAVRALKAEAGKDIWLMGGGVLFRSLLDMGLVDALQLCIFPVLLGAGTPLLPDGQRANLKLTESKTLPSGVLMLSYAVEANRRS